MVKIHGVRYYLLIFIYLTYLMDSLIDLRNLGAGPSKIRYVVIALPVLESNRLAICATFGTTLGMTCWIVSLLYNLFLIFQRFMRSYDLAIISNGMALFRCFGFLAVILDAYFSKARHLRTENDVWSYDIYTTLWQHIWPQNYEQRSYAVASYTCSVLGSYIRMLLPSIEAKISHSTNELQLPIYSIIAYFSLHSLVLCLDSGSSHLWTKFEGYCSKTLKERLFAHEMRQSGDFHDDKRLGGLNLGLHLHFLIKMIIDTISTAIDVILAARYFTAILGSYTTVIIFVILALYTFFSQKLILAEQSRQNHALGKEFSIQSAATTLWRTVAYNNGIRFEINRYIRTVTEAFKIQIEQSYRSNVESLQMSLISSAAKALAQCCMAYQIVQGRAHPSDFIIFISYWEKINNSLNWLFRQLKHVPDSFSRIKRLTLVLRHPPAVPHRPNAERLEKCVGRIKFEHVSFGFTEKQLILNDVSFSVEPGEFVAIVGRTGAGKSTIFNLLTLFNQPCNRSIYIDNRNIHNLAVNDIRQYMAIVPQSPEFFSDSIIYNLKYANKQASDSDIKKICEMLYLNKEIINSIGGYNSQIGQRRGKLSGGQRQRLALAAAYLRSTPIVLLDKPTSWLDAKTSKKIRDHNLWHGATCLNITYSIHKLSEAITASQILVLDEGKIVEQGSHEQLMDSRGRYYELWLAQLDEDTKSTPLPWLDLAIPAK